MLHYAKKTFKFFQNSLRRFYIFQTCPFFEISKTHSKNSEKIWPYSLHNFKNFLFYKIFLETPSLSWKKIFYEYLIQILSDLEKKHGSCNEVPMYWLECVVRFKIYWLIQYCIPKTTKNFFRWIYHLLISPVCRIWMMRCPTLINVETN